MSENNANKIILVSLCDKWTADVGKMLAQSLGMMFCDVKDLVEYELIDKERIERLCSKEYLVESERKVMRHVASFENVVVAISFDYFTNNQTILKKNALMIFLDAQKKYIEENAGAIAAISYDAREKTAREFTDAVVSVRKTDTEFVCKKIIETLRGLL